LSQHNELVKLYGIARRDSLLASTLRRWVRLPWPDRVGYSQRTR